MSRQREPAFAILRIRRDLLKWDTLSPEQKALAVVVQNVLLGATEDLANEETVRLNNLNEDDADLYISVYARVSDVSSGAS